MGSTRTRGLLSASNVMTAALVGAAGLVAWFGSTTVRESVTGGHEPAPAAETVTIPGEPDSVPVVLGRSAEGLLPTRVVVPAAGVDQAVTEVGVVVKDGKPAWETAWKSVGHLLSSARPGQPGNMVLTGHVSVADAGNVAAFQSLDRVAVGDVVEVYAGTTKYSYRVTNVQVVAPTQTKVLRSDHQTLVTLITCTPDLKQRLVVTAAFEGKDQL